MDKGIFGNHYFPSGSVGIPHRKCLTLTGNIDQNLDNGSNYSPKTDLKPILGKECIPAGSHEESYALPTGLLADAGVHWNSCPAQ